MQRWDTHQAASGWIPLAGSPYCVGRAGAVGTIVAAGPELQFEGDGRYTVKVSVGPGSGGASGCLAGPSTTASFRVDVRVAPALIGGPEPGRASRAAPPTARTTTSTRPSSPRHGRDR